MRHLFGPPRPRRPLIAAACIALGAVSLAGATLGAQTGTIVGRVIDARATLAIPQATLEVEGTRVATATGPDGQFRLVGVPAGQHTVIARRIGFASMRRAATVTANGEVTVNFALEPAAISLDEVVVTGTAGGEQRRSISNAVSTLDAAAEMDKAAASSITSLLNARSPGLTVQATTGRLGATPTIQIRGRNSIGLPNSPLVYVDGVRVSSATATGPGGSGGLGSQASAVAGRL